MEAKAKQRNIKMSARKIRRIINEVRDKSVLDAVKILRYMPYAAARVVEKNLNDVIANAAEKYGVDSNVLKISAIYADEGVTSKRAKPRAQGRIYRRMKRTSHLTIKVTVDKQEKVK